MGGLFISLEGVDGCGKSTQTRLLSRWLRAKGFSVICTDEPTDGPIGRIAKRILRGELRIPIEAEVHLFAADRAWHLARVISPALKVGKVVINERYVSSSLAYQVARGASRALVERANSFALEPDLALFIDVPPKIAVARIKGRKLDEFERDLELQRRVRREYMRMVARGKLKLIEGGRPVAEVQREIRELVNQALEKCLR